MGGPVGGVVGNTTGNGFMLIRISIIVDADTVPGNGKELMGRMVYYDLRPYSKTPRGFHAAPV